MSISPLLSLVLKPLAFSNISQRLLQWTQDQKLLPMLDPSHQPKAHHSYSLSIDVCT
jgi:hypothetical protein